MENKIERKSNFEVLRIVSIVLILFHHFYYNNFQLDYNNITTNQFIMQFLSTFGKVGVNCFVLITGYFMINSKRKIKKLIFLWGEVFFYSFVIMLLYAIFINNDISIKSIVKCIFSITYNEYWFITNYIIIYLLSDFINKFIKSLNKKELLQVIGILILMWVITPSIIGAKFEFSNLGWFILMYMIGAYIKLYPIRMFEKNKKVYIVLMILLVLSISSIYILNNLYIKLKINPLSYALPMNQIIPFGISICLFIIFKNLNIKNSNNINKIAACSLGVYLIHTQILIRDFIWIDTLKINLYLNSNYLILYEIFAVFLVYFVCVAIDLIRKYIVEKFLMKLINKTEEKIIIKKDKIVNYINSKKEG